MIHPSSTLAHLAKFFVTIGCMRTLGNEYDETNTWSFRAFQILLSHSVLGALRFGTPFLTSTTNVAKYLRIFYDWYSMIVDVMSLALFTAGILQGYGISEKVWLVLLSLGILPIFFHLQPKRKQSQIRRHQLFMNITTTLQLLMITLVGLRNNDFKPASVDVSKVAKVDVGANNTMTVTVPHLDGAGIPHTVFKGSQRPYHKECVLIIDRVTGEITLEKLSANIQVKKTRTEPKSQLHLAMAGANSNRPITPVEMKKSPTHGRATGRMKMASGKKKEPSVQVHPRQCSPLRVSPYGKSPPSTSINSSPVQQPSVAPSTLASLPMISSDNDDCTLTSSGSLPATNSSASVKSSSVTNTQSAVKSSVTADSDEGALSDSTSSSSSSDSSDSDSDNENVTVLTGTNGHLNSRNSSPTLLMPDNLLNDDLQLSESESDSD